MKNIFGTDGIRDKFNQGPLTTENLTQLGHAIGQWATNSFEKPIRILIGYDTRSSCPSILTTLSQTTFKSISTLLSRNKKNREFFHYPTTAPEERPLTICFCMSKYTIIIGTAAIVSPAIRTG